MKKFLIALTASALFAFTASAQELDMVQIPGKNAQELDMVQITGKNFKILRTEVTQELYVSVMGENPSKFKKSNNPVEMVSWYDAIYFCNKLSMKKGLSPVYAVDGETDVAKWNYTLHKGNWLDGEVTQDVSANGFRLPTVEEWEYASKGGQNYEYSGSDNLDEVGWYERNSNDMTHKVARKKPNGYGLYDMSGNVREWCWDSDGGGFRYNCGGAWYLPCVHCRVDAGGGDFACDQYRYLGFRIVCAAE